MNSTTPRMTIEIWSDVMCPFCYIGKRKFETALAQFNHRSNIDIVWKSFQLAPDLKTNPDKNIHQFLAEHKGMSLEQAKRMNDQMAQAAKQVGLHYDFDKAIPANSFNAHRFSHLAKQHGLQNDAEERLFKAYFTEGKNIDDISTLVQLGVEIGLAAAEIKTVLESDQYTKDVHQDIDEAQQVGVRGVPFFVLDRKYAISGAQNSETFLQAIDTSYAEWLQQNPSATIEITEGASCKADGECD
jgi:predicted DsbA family dithiol-disulfide isomerase